MQKWAESELQQADLGDARRNKRLVRIVEDLASQPASSVPQEKWKYSSDNSSV